MNPKAMQPFGRALAAYIDGNAAAQLLIRRDDGQTSPLPVSYFFREGPALTLIDHAAIDRSKGRILDAGAGTGLHSLALKKKGLTVTALDISPHAVDIMRQRGLTDVHCADIFEFAGGPFDTVLMMGHGVGVVETLTGLDRFLKHARTLLATDGQVLLDSMDVRKTEDPKNLAYHEANRRAGRYVGEVRMQFEFGGETGPFCGWLHVDPETLAEHAARAGWNCEIIRQEESGEYLARLTKANNRE